MEAEKGGVPEKKIALIDYFRLSASMSSITIQYASDLHLEFPKNKDFLKINPLQPKGNVLLLAGDIVPFAVINKHADFFSYISDHFNMTYWIPGNHEYYYFDVAARSGMLCEKIRNNVLLVNNTSLRHGDIQFIFSTLWSKISADYQWQIEKGMSDFQVIKYQGYKFSAERFNQLHEDGLAFLAHELQGPNSLKKVVVTHHVPTLMHYPEQYKGDILNEAFAVELYDFIEADGPDYWIYGHHHHNTLDFKIGKTRLLTNQLGYVQAGEHGLFDQGNVFSL